jgi:hypothetical protein
VASPIVVADVTSPAGDIDPPIWFPGESDPDVNTRLTGYIADAYTKTDEDDAAEQWVYYRAATAVADRLAGGHGASTTLTLVDQGSKTTTASAAQADYWAAKAAAYLAAFEELDADIDEDALGGFNVITSLRHG